MKIVFFGTPVFAAHILSFLYDAKVNIVAVVSKPDRPQGRSRQILPTPVKTIALSMETKPILLQPESAADPEFAAHLQSLQADLFVVVAYGEILKTHLLEMPKKGCINLHTSLLPKFRGAAPIQRSIIEGETETGVTIMHMAKKMDAGDIIKQVSIPIEENASFGEIEALLCQVGKEALLEVIHTFEKQEPPRTPQDHSLASFAPKIELEECEIDWNRPAKELHNRVRGTNPVPGAWCYISVKEARKRLSIIKTRIVPCNPAPPGTILNKDATKGNLLIATGTEGLALELVEIQLEGKKKMSSEELCRGLSRNWLHM